MLEFITVNTHSSIRIDEGKIVYIDPYDIKDEAADADIILITHDHFDHFSPEDIQKVMKQDTVLICPESMEVQIEGLSVVKAAVGEKIETKGVSIETVAAYNQQKPFHPKDNGWIGYIINSSEHGRIYIAGDTDITEENKQVKCDIALLPVGGTFTMDNKQAAELANIIRPEYVIPVHYGSIAGAPEDGEKFGRAVDKDIKVVFKM